MGSKNNLVSVKNSDFEVFQALAKDSESVHAHVQKEYSQVKINIFCFSYIYFLFYFLFYLYIFIFYKSFIIARPCIDVKAMMIVYIYYRK